MAYRGGGGAEGAIRPGRHFEGVAKNWKKKKRKKGKKEKGKQREKENTEEACDYSKTKMEHRSKLRRHNARII